MEALSRFAQAVGAPSPEFAIDQLCQRLLSESGLGVPVDIERALRQLGVACRYVSEGPAGRIVVVGSRFEVLVRVPTTRERRRFTLAHELGHLLLMKSLSSEPAALRAVLGHGDPSVERLCDRAAGRVLLPESALRVEALDLELSLQRLTELRARFDVSWSALLIELSRVFLGVHFYLWQDSRRDGRLRLVSSLGETLWFPSGISSRHLTPDIVVASTREKTSISELVVLSLRPGHRVSGRGLAFVLPRRGRTDEASLFGAAFEDWRSSATVLLMVDARPSPRTEDVDSAGRVQLTLPI